MIVRIKQEVSLEHKHLTSKLKTHMFEKIKTMMTGKCTVDYGYIIKIIKIVDIGDNTIGTANSLVFFNVTYDAEILKPEIGQILTGTVCMIFQHGIFVNILDKMKVLIPATAMSSFSFENSSFVGNDLTITDGVELNIRITMIKYEKKVFSCIGELEIESNDGEVNNEDSEEDEDSEADEDSDSDDEDSDSDEEDSDSDEE